MYCIPNPVTNLCFRRNFFNVDVPVHLEIGDFRYILLFCSNLGHGLFLEPDWLCNNADNHADCVLYTCKEYIRIKKQHAHHGFV